MENLHTAKIVAITQPLISGIQTSEELISYVARVSNPGNQMNTATSEKLLKYCFKQKHFSIFEMVNVVMQIDTTRDIARQILRHRSFSFQEFSQRYADPTAELGLIDSREARLQDTRNRQNSIETDNDDLHQQWSLKQKQIADLASNTYNWAINQGIAKEQARAVLPEGLTQSRLYANGTLRSWIHYCDLRTDEYIDAKTGETIKGTQKEHRLIAETAKAELTKHFEFLKSFWK